MGAIYRLSYPGRGSATGGIIYVGNSSIAGADQAGALYDGSFYEERGCMKVAVNLTVPAGTTLAGGKHVAQATVMPVTAEWPLNFTNGQRLTMFVWNNPIHVAFEKIRDIPSG